MVKSRRTASCAWLPKTLSESSRPCSSLESSPAWRPRKVDTSVVSEPDRTCTRLLGRGVGGDVEVLRLEAEEEVAHRAADDERLEAGLLQLARHLQRGARDLAAANPMGVGTEEARRSDRPAGDQPREEATNQLFEVARRPVVIMLLSAEPGASQASVEPGDGPAAGRRKRRPREAKRTSDHSMARGSDGRVWRP
jgi:hypothetical protein